MDKNYYCNDVWFYTYEQAKLYSDTMLELEGKYRVVFTKAEIDSQINHEQECGK